MEDDFCCCGAGIRSGGAEKMAPAKAPSFAALGYVSHLSQTLKEPDPRWRPENAPPIERVSHPGLAHGTKS